MNETITNRSTVRRMPARGSHEEAMIHAILDAGFMAYTGFSVEGQPFVIPTLFGREDNTLYLHGSAASRMMRHLETGAPACVNVTHVDGLVLARSAFHHSMNYRSVVAFGTAIKVETEEEKAHGLWVVSEHLIRGRWEAVRPPTPKELKGTTVLRFAIEEASAKDRIGEPGDDEEDYALPIWAGVLPLAVRPGTPIPDGRLAPGIEVPDHVSQYKPGKQRT